MKSPYSLSFIILLFSLLLQACNEKEKPKLVYIMAPHCGWCFGNTKNMAELYHQFKDDFEFEVMVGGMWLGDNSWRGGGDLTKFVKKHAPSIANFTGLNISEKYFKLTNDTTYVFDGLAPSSAIVLVKELAPEKAFMFSENVLKTSFTQGKRLDRIETYTLLLNELSINTDEFKAKWLSDNNITKTEAEFLKTDTLANGFPSLLLINGDKITELSSGAFKLKFLIEKLTQFKNSTPHS